MYSYMVFDGRWMGKPERAEVFESLGEHPDDNSAIREANICWRGYDAYVCRYHEAENRWLFVKWLFKEEQGGGR